MITEHLRIDNTTFNMNLKIEIICFSFCTSLKSKGFIIQIQIEKQIQTTTNTMTITLAIKYTSTSCFIQETIKGMGETQFLFDNYMNWSADTQKGQFTHSDFSEINL